MKSINLNVAAVMAALAADMKAGAAAFAQSFQPAASWRGATAPKRRAKKTSYGQGLKNHFARQQRDRMQAKKIHPLRDERGAFTLVGRGAAQEHSEGFVQHQLRTRRMWLGGISAQRGY